MSIIKAKNLKTEWKTNDILILLAPEFRKWKKQGRTDEQIYGVVNFLTGQGKLGVERLLREKK